MLARNDLATYLAETYGECELGSGRCYHGPGPQCLKLGWRGTACPHWKPTKTTTMDELRDEMRKMYETK